MTFEIAGRKIGSGHPTYFIAEISCNHNQQYDIASALILAAHSAGADAVKLQTYTPDTMTIDCDKECFKIKDTIWNGESLYDLYKRAYTPWEWTQPLKTLANSLGMDLFTSPFDPTAVDYLEKLEVPAYKIASFEVNDHILLKKVAQTGKPVIMSTGMASLKDIESGLKVLRNNGCGPIALLKCTSAYPSLPEDANLSTIPNMAQTFGTVVGLSDHTLGIEVPIVAVALGACIVEKHFTFSRSSGSPDDEFSLTPEEFKNMVDTIRKTEKMIGKITYGGVKNENSSRQLRRSLFFVENIVAGQELTPLNVRSIRPGFGLHTEQYDMVIGKKARKDIERGTPVSWDLIE